MTPYMSWSINVTGAFSLVDICQAYTEGCDCQQAVVDRLGNVGELMT